MIARHRTEIKTSQIIKALLNNFKNNKNSFEKALQKYFNVKKVLLTPSGRSGIYFVLKALNKQIAYLPAFTCWVVPEAAMQAGKKIRYIDIDLNTFNMNIEQLDQNIRNNSIIIATHQFGIPCEIDKIKELAINHNCFLLEDCAGAFGSEYKGQKAGTFGDVAVVSFEQTKTLACGQGGAILFNNLNYYEKIVDIYKQNIYKKIDWKNVCYVSIYNLATSSLLYKYITLPYLLKKNGLTTGKKFSDNNRTGLYTIDFDSFKAGLGLQNLKRIENLINKRKSIVNIYLQELENLNGISLPQNPEDNFWSPIRFPIRITAGSKYDFYWKCKQKGLDLGFSFSYSCAEESERDQVRNSFIAAEQILNLPMYSRLSTEEVYRIIEIIKMVNS